jgi:ATP-dependent DNA helicase RecQ
VSDWTVEYADLSHGTITVEYNGCDENSIKEHLFKYIRKYDVEFTLENANNKRYSKYIEILNSDQKAITKYIKILIEWGNNNILAQRLQSIWNMVELCYPDVSDDSFRRRIEYYFRYTEVTIVFDEIVYHPQEYRRWFSLLYDTDQQTMVKKMAITKKKAENMLASLSRYLESYQNNTGLNYMSGILRLLSNQYAQSEGEARFKDAWENIKQMDKAKIDDVINETLNIGQAMDMDNRIHLSKIICDNFLDKQSSVFKKLQDPYSLKIELEKSLKRLDDIKGRE